MYIEPAFLASGECVANLQQGYSSIEHDLPLNSLSDRPISSARRVPVDAVPPQRSLRRRDTASHPSLRTLPVARDGEPRCALAESAFWLITTGYTYFHEVIA
jgi:hypothetical protein